jgi:hypothetical protein
MLLDLFPYNKESLPYFMGQWYGPLQLAFFFSLLYLSSDYNFRLASYKSAILAHQFNCVLQLNTGNYINIFVLCPQTNKVIQILLKILPETQQIST